MGLTPDQFAAGRQVKRGRKTYDILDVVTGNAGNQFVLARSGDSTELVPASLLRDEDSDFESVSVEDQEAARADAADQADDTGDDSDSDEGDSSPSKRSNTPTPRKKS